jgi:hypothetical protein
MYNPLFDKMREHIGHTIECVSYGTDFEIINVAIECVDCCVVITDADADNGNEGEYADVQ